MGWTAAQLRARIRDNPDVRLAPTGRGTPARAPTAPPSPTATPRPAHPALQHLFDTLQGLANDHGWENRYTYNAEGPEAGLHVTLVRGMTVLFAEVVLTREALTPSLQAWLAALHGTGQVEAYVWTPQDRETIRRRLSRPRAEAAEGSACEPRTPAEMPQMQERRRRTQEGP